MGRYIGFLQNLGQSQKHLIGLLFRTCCHNLGTVTGQNVNYLLKKYNKSDIQSLLMDKNKIKKSRVYSLPVEDSWKINIIEELSLVKKSHLELDFDEKNLEEILEYICTA